MLYKGNLHYKQVYIDRAVELAKSLGVSDIHNPDPTRGTFYAAAKYGGSEIHICIATLSGAYTRIYLYPIKSVNPFCSWLMNNATGQLITDPQDAVHMWLNAFVP